MSQSPDEKLAAAIMAALPGTHSQQNRIDWITNVPDVLISDTHDHDD